MNKDQWIDEVLASAKGAERVAINPYLHTRVKAKLEATPATIPLRWALVALAPVMVLLALNVTLWRKQFPKKQNPGMEQVIKAYSVDDSYLYSSTNNETAHEKD